MENINGVGTFNPSLTQEQCLKNNIGICEAGMEICNSCSEKEQGQRRKWDNDFEKSCQEKKRTIKSVIKASFFLCCSLLFALGIISGFFAKSISAKIILAAFFFCTISYKSRNKLDGRIVYDGMEKPFTFSLGATIFFLGSLLVSQKMEYAVLTFLCYVPGIYLFYQGYNEGPLYGWENYFENKKIFS